MDHFGVIKPSLKAIAETPVIPALKVAEKTPAKAVAKVKEFEDPYWLGAKLHALVGDEFSAYGVSKESGGLAFVELSKDSEAAKAGLQDGDLIQMLNGKQVSTSIQFFDALITAGSAPLKLSVVRNQQAMDLSIESHSYIEIETVSDAEGFKKLPLPAEPVGEVSANQKTNEAPLESLLDGQLSKGYGPMFGNAVHSGAYRIDLGSSQPITGITSWSFAKADRGTQKVTLMGSDSANDPGWNFSAFTPLGTIDTTGAAKAEFTAASLRAPAGKSLGNFRWIIWSVAPVTSKGGGENTAFQELSVEVGTH